MNMKKKINNVDKDVVFDSVISSLDKVYKKYGFLNISRNDFVDIVKKIIMESDYQNYDKFDVKFYEDKLNQYFNMYINNILLSEDGINFLDDYINVNLKSPRTYDRTLVEVKKLGLIFCGDDLSCYFDLFLGVLKKNSKINNILRVIFEYNKLYLENNLLNDVFGDSIICFLMEVYCSFYDINLINYDNSFDNLKLDCTNDKMASYFKDIDKPLLSYEEEKELGYRILNGDSFARKIMIERNLRLVVSVSKKFLGRGLDFQDLIQEGNIGLIMAADTFDITKGYKFSTYAMYCIKNSIHRAICNKGRNIRIPVNRASNVLKYGLTYYDLKNKFNREPTIDEIADSMGISYDEAIYLYSLQRNTVSFYEKYNDDMEYIEVLSDDNSLDEEIIKIDLEDGINKLLIKCGLNDREINVLCLRYGLGGSGVYTYQEIASMYGVTHQRINLIELSALKKIRCSEYVKDFAIYLDKPCQGLEYLDFCKEQYANGVIRIKKIIK